MIGTTRSRVSFFMNKFRKLGLIDYNGQIEIHTSLLNVVYLRNRTSTASARPVGEKPRLGFLLHCYSDIGVR